MHLCKKKLFISGIFWLCKKFCIFASLIEYLWLIIFTKNGTDNRLNLFKRVSPLLNDQPNQIYMSTYCPNCITELIPDNKKFGEYTVWLVCPNKKCWFRTRPSVERRANESKNLQLTNHVEHTNKNNKFHENLH
jgi:hypothetical protein